MEETTSNRKKGSRRTKKAWRKKTDVKDVEEHLSDIRREERTGGIIADKEDASLYFVEKTITTVDKEIVTSKKVENSKVDDSSDEERYIPRNVRQAKKWQEEKRKEQGEKDKLTQGPRFSVWEGSEKFSMSPENEVISHTVSRKPKKPLTVGEKVSLIPAVEVCHPGQSYNPEYDDHQSLLAKANEIEVKKAEGAAKLQKKLQYLTQEQFVKNPTWVEEMSEGLVDKESTGKTEESSSEVDEASEGPVIVNIEMKTKKKRRKEKEQKEEKRQRQQKKKEKVRQNEIFRLKALKRDLDEEEEKVEDRRRNKILKEEAEADKPKRLSKHVYQDSNIPIKLSDELVGSLRELKPEGNLLEERFKSLQKRNIIETRKPVIPHRKYKLKQFEKRSYKTPTIKEFGEAQGT